MVSTASLWLPIVLSSVAVFFVTAFLWMVLRIHRSDWPVVEDESLLAAIRDAKLDRGQYALNPVREANADLTRNPPGFLILYRPSLRRSMPQSFLYNLLISTVVAYLAGRHLAPASAFSSVFSFVAVAAALGYSGALLTGSIWFGRTWRSILTEVFDGIVYGVVTGAVFGGLWPS